MTAAGQIFTRAVPRHTHCLNGPLLPSYYVKRMPSFLSSFCYIAEQRQRPAMSGPYLVENAQNASSTFQCLVLCLCENHVIFVKLAISCPDRSYDSMVERYCHPLLRYDCLQYPDLFRACNNYISEKISICDKSLAVYRTIHGTCKTDPHPVKKKKKTFQNTDQTFLCSSAFTKASHVKYYIIL